MLEEPDEQRNHPLVAVTVDVDHLVHVHAELAEHVERIQDLALERDLGVGDGLLDLRVCLVQKHFVV